MSCLHVNSKCIYYITEAKKTQWEYLTCLFNCTGKSSCHLSSSNIRILMKCLPFNVCCSLITLYLNSFYNFKIDTYLTETISSPHYDVLTIISLLLFISLIIYLHIIAPNKSPHIFVSFLYSILISISHLTPPS